MFLYSLICHRGSPPLSIHSVIRNSPAQKKTTDSPERKLIDRLRNIKKAVSRLSEILMNKI